MLKIRLQRVGRKNDPSFRVVVTDSRRGPKSSNYLEILGSYHPKTKAIDLKGDRIKHWMDHGAQVSGTVHNLLIKNSIISGDTINVLPKKSPVVKEAEEKAEVAPETKEETADSVETPTKEAPAETNEAPKEKTAEKNTEEVSVEKKEEPATPSAEEKKEEAKTEKVEEKKEA
jgi:small subunit ribosomal protein S16